MRPPEIHRTMSRGPGRRLTCMDSVSGRQRPDFSIRGPIARTDLPGLCDRVCRLFSGRRGGIAVCDVRGVGPDAVTVDALARLQLAALQHGCQVRLRNASDELRDLVCFMGLADVLPDEG